MMWQISFFLGCIIPVLGIGLFESNISIIFWGSISILIMILTMGKRGRDLYKQTIIIYWIIIALMMILYYGYIDLYGMPYYMGGSDDYQFEKWASYCMDNNIFTPVQMLNDYTLMYNNSKGFIVLISVVMRISKFFGGYHTLAYRILNISFLIMIGIIMYKYVMNSNLLKRRNALFLYYFIVLFPSSIYISIHVFRDTISALLLITAYYLINKSKKTSIYNWVLILIILYVSYWIRSFNLYYILMFMFIKKILDKYDLRKNYFKIFMVGILALIVIQLFGVFEDLMRHNAIYNEYIGSNTSGISNIIFSMPFFPMGIIFRIMYGMVYPLPIGILNIFRISIDVNNFFDFFTSIGGIIQIILLPYLLKSLKDIRKESIAFLGIFVSIVCTTFGFRHFIMLYPFMFLLILLSLERESFNKIISKFIFMSLMLGIFGGAYLLISV